MKNLDYEVDKDRKYGVTKRRRAEGWSDGETSDDREHGYQVHGHPGGYVQHPTDWGRRVERLSSL